MSILICECMEDNESILIRGAEQFSSYSGYGGALKFTGPHTDTNPIDESNRRCVSIVAIDATPFGYENDEQFDVKGVLRELDKAYCGFGFRIPGDDVESNKMRAVATGNWGCGAFGGDKELKSLLQWMAASMAGRPLKYYSFRDRWFAKEQEKLFSLLHEKGVNVGLLYTILSSCLKDMPQKGVFNCVREKVTNIQL